MIAEKLPRLTVILLMTMLAGCATLDSGDARDPFEDMNRAVFVFNEKADNAVLKPIAKGYRAVVPTPVDKGISNVLGNIEDIASAFNSLLQLKVRQGGQDIARVLINSTAGLLGLLDVASDMGLPKHREDFGQTLGHWGAGAGPYLVLPFLGPSTLRDTIGMAVDQVFDPTYSIDHTATRNSLIVTNAIDTRADFLGASNILEKAALDRYSFLKESYLQKREIDINGDQSAFPEFE